MPEPAPSCSTASYETVRAGDGAADLDLLRWPALAPLGVDAAWTTRSGGVSTGPYQSLNLGLHVGDDPEAVLENRRRAAAALGADLGHLVFADQVHGRHAAVVRSGDAGRGAHRQDDALAATDALVTGAGGPVLATLVADCSPILLVDPEARVLATVHAGWRGCLAGVGAATVAAMGSLGARPDRIRAVVGPTVAFERYEVGPEVADAATSALGDEAPTVLVPRGDRFLLDVAGANRRLLVAAGLEPHHVHLVPVATDDPRFFSDRAERPCGRFALLARLTP